MVRITVNRGLLNKTINQQLDKKKRTLAIALDAKLTAKAPKDTGQLAVSHTVIVTEKGLEVTNSQPYAKYVHAMPQSKLKSGEAQWIYKSIHETIRGD